jgi:hypothetical protein
MTKESGCTATLARVYADQGHYRQAMDIYRVLIRENPEREDYQEALKDLEERPTRHASHPGGEMENHGARTIDDLVPLFEQWLDLLLQHQRHRILKKIKKCLSRHPR